MATRIVCEYEDGSKAEFVKQGNGSWVWKNQVFTPLKLASWISEFIDTSYWQMPEESEQDA